MPGYSGGNPGTLMGVSRALANSPLGCFAPRCGGDGLFDSSAAQHKKRTPCRDTAVAFRER